MSTFSTHYLKGIGATLNQVTIPAGHTFRVNGSLNNSLNTGAFQLPSGGTSSRPNSPQTGYFRYNTDNNIIEIYDGSAWVDYNFAGAVGGGGGSSQPTIPDEYLAYVFNAQGDARSPNFKTLGTLSVADPSVTAANLSEVQANTSWTVARFTSVNNPGVQYRFQRGTNIDVVVESLLANYSNWTASTNSTYAVTPLAGSSTRVGQPMNFQHNNGGGESHDIVTLGYPGTVWSTGMIWGNIDSTGNYAGIVNTPYAPSGSGGGNTGDTLFMYLETGSPTYNPADYTNYLTPSGPLGNATTFNWTNSTSSGQGSSSPNNVADAVSRDTTNSWPTYGIQMNGNTCWIRVDLGSGNEQSFDFTFCIGYPGDSHWSNRNEIQGSNDDSNWTTVAQWDYHNGSASSADGYLIYNAGGHMYSNTINNTDKWIPINTNGIKYRYWRLYGSNFNTSNGYMLVMNWALLQKNS